MLSVRPDHAHTGSRIRLVPDPDGAGYLERTIPAVLADHPVRKVLIILNMSLVDSLKEPAGLRYNGGAFLYADGQATCRGFRWCLFHDSLLVNIAGHTAYLRTR